MEYFGSAFVGLCIVFLVGYNLQKYGSPKASMIGRLLSFGVRIHKDVPTWQLLIDANDMVHSAGKPPCCLEGRIKEWYAESGLFKKVRQAVILYDGMSVRLGVTAVENSGVVIEDVYKKAVGGFECIEMAEEKLHEIVKEHCANIYNERKHHS